MVDRQLTGAHYGLRDWAMQRITAVIMVIYTVAMIVILFTLPHEYDAWRAFFTKVGYVCSRKLPSLPWHCMHG